MRVVVLCMLTTGVLAVRLNMDFASGLSKILDNPPSKQVKKNNPLSDKQAFPGLPGDSTYDSSSRVPPAEAFAKHVPQRQVANFSNNMASGGNVGKKSNKKKNKYNNEQVSDVNLNNLMSFRTHFSSDNNINRDNGGNPRNMKKADKSYTGTMRFSIKRSSYGEWKVHGLWPDTQSGANWCGDSRIAINFEGLEDEQAFKSWKKYWGRNDLLGQLLQYSWRSIDEFTQRDLKQIAVNTDDPEAFWAWEYEKHGTCAFKNRPTDYFAAIYELYQKMKLRNANEAQLQADHGFKKAPKSKEWFIYVDNKLEPIKSSYFQ